MACSVLDCLLSASLLDNGFPLLGCAPAPPRSCVTTRLASVVPRTLRPAYYTLICAQDPRAARWRDGGGPGCHWGMGFQHAGVGVQSWPGAWGRSGWRAEAPGRSWLCCAGRGMEEGLLAAGTLSTGRELSDLPSVAITADSMAQVGLAALSLLSSPRGQSSASSLPCLDLGASRPARLTQCPGGQPGSVPPAPPPGAPRLPQLGPGDRACWLCLATALTAKSPKKRGPRDWGGDAKQVQGSPAH